MNKLLTTILLSVAWCLGVHAQNTYTVVGPEDYFGSNWDGTDTNNDMILNPSCNKYYLVKEVTVTGNTTTTIRFKVYKNRSSDNAITYGTTWPNYNSEIKLAAGTYQLVFCMNSDESGLDVVTKARISEDYSSKLWTEEEMAFDEAECKFYLVKNVSNVSAGDKGSFKAIVSHRSSSDNTYYGTDGYSNGSNIEIVFSNAGNYEITFVLDPVEKGAPTYSLRTYVEKEIGADGYSTYSYPHALEVSGNVLVYYITGQNGTKLVTAKTKKIPATTFTPTAGTGVILKGDPNTTYKFYLTDETVTLTDNKLSGTGSGTFTVAANETYVFAKSGGKIGFYPAIAGTYETNKAYLPASEVSSSREYYGLDFDEELTNIDGIFDEPEAAPCYNLQGQEVEHPTRGLYIRNGRKVILK